MFELGKVAGSGMVQQDGKTGSSKRRSFGEEAINSIMDNYKSGKTNNNKGSHQDVKEKNNYDDYNKFNNLMEKSKLSNSPLKEADLLANGFKKNDLRDKNGGVYYTNPKTGEEIRLCDWEGSNSYTAKDGTKYTQYFDKSGKPAGGEVTVKNKNGGYVIYRYDNDIMGNSFIKDIERYNPPTDKASMAAEGVQNHRARIDEFEKSLGIPDYYISPNAVVRRKDGTEVQDGFTEDGNYRIRVITQKDGSRRQIYYKLAGFKDYKPVYKKLGFWQTTKEPSSGLKDHSWAFEAKNYLTGGSTIISS